ncbi:hypothetical protein B0T17DRAFT_613072 [Bombardia bombarda]|uniref:Uncharacterized protein n=1 Tax=Bombardia bombarda TaxID=252184 RepID=A0AA39XMH9_9PEZI|nr:hypothetical protein B0T17DRAFT_613072 [Bombardia bombarda]
MGDSQRNDGRSITVFSGGTGANSLVDVFNGIIERRKYSLNYVIPISDNGGSSSELIRVIGGPSVGDIRSRLVRLIPNTNTDAETGALRRLFELRLCSDSNKARDEWLEIVFGSHVSWNEISSPKRELIRSILNALNLEIVKRARPKSSFNFARASIGNMFLTGARLFTGSFEAAIYLLSMICSIPASVAVLPAINSNFTHHISALLEDGTPMVGQVAISHPSAPTALPDDQKDHDESESDNQLPDCHPDLRGEITVSKEDEADLPARIKSLSYINTYGHTISPKANPKVLEAMKSSAAVVYSIGSLYTSIIPSLVLQGVGEAITAPVVKYKILILNSKLDRETGPKSNPLTAIDFVTAIARAGAQSKKRPEAAAAAAPSDAVIRPPTNYVTHLIYLDAKDAPFVDVKGIECLGIKCVKVDGKMTTDKAMVKYDEAALGKALENILDP